MIEIFYAALIARARDQIVDAALHLRLFVKVEINLRLRLELLLKKLPITVFRHKLPSPSYISLHLSH